MARKSLADILSGEQRFGRLLVIREIESKPGEARMVECICDCGERKPFHLNNVKTGKTLSCGCRTKDVNRALRTTHGESRRRGVSAETAEYRVWCHMIYRCHNEESKDFCNYGGRGIQVCERWGNSYQSFLEDMGRRPSNRHQIDRSDNELGYYPGNCKWVERPVQCRNKRTNRYVSVGGNIMVLSDAAKIIGVDRRILGKKLMNGPYMGAFECSSKTA